MKALLRFFIIVSLVVVPSLLRAQLSANFTGNNLAGCSPVVCNFTDHTTGGTPTWYKFVYIWDTATAPQVYGTSAFPSTEVFTDTGYYDIMEIVANSVGDTDTIVKHHYIYVSPLPTVSFTTLSPATDTVLSCPGKVVTFVNTTFTSPTSGGCTPQYAWHILGTNGLDTILNTTGVSATLPFTFSNPGNYTVRLTQTSACNCAGYVIYGNYIKIDSLPVSCFTANNPNTCGPPDSVFFNSSCSVNAVSFLWHFGGGGTSVLSNPAHVYTATGSYSDTLTVFSTAGCANRVYQMNDVTVGNFVPGFVINALPPFCAGVSINFHPLTHGLNNLWHDNLGNTVFAPGPTIQYYTAGIITVVDSQWDGGTCSAIDSVSFTVFPLPVISFTATSTYRCTPNDTVHFFSNVYDTSGIASLLWTFGDLPSGHFDTARSDSSHIYTTVGSFTPKLYVRDNIGCVDSAMHGNYIGIHPPGVAINPHADSGCAPFPFCYTTSISPGGITFITDSVNYGDGTIHCVGNGCADSCHTYTLGGYYKVKHYYHLPAIYGGCSYADSIHVSVGSLHPIMHPYAFPDSLNPYTTKDTVCPNTWVYFRDSCSNCTSFTWYLDGPGSTPANVFNDSERYAALGLVTITAIGDVNGCTDTLYPSVFVLPPLANVTPPLVPNCDSSNVFHFSSAGSTGATAFHWSFGDGNFSTVSTPTHVYTVPGSGASFNVVLVDTGGGTHHCINKDSVTVNVYPFIDAFNANDTSVCRFVNVLFTGPIPPNGGYYTQYSWTFTSAGTSPVTDVVPGNNTLVYAFTDTGIYNVRLIVQNAYGCADTLAKHAYIHVTGPIGGFSASPLTGCTPLTVNFHDNNSVVGGSTITSRQWQFSGPGIVAGVPATLYYGHSTDTFYTYPEGSFRVVLIDSDNNHCFSYDSIRIRSQKPHAYFTANHTHLCIGKTVTFTDTNSFCSYAWSFGDGTTGTGKVVSHIYSVNGTYSVSVSVITGIGGALPVGCTDTFKRIGYITIGSINVSFNLDSVAACPPFDPSAYATATVPGYSYFWDINHTPHYFSNSFNSFDSIFHVAGFYTITLIDSNSLGCMDSVTHSITISGPAGIVTATPNNGCAPLSVQIQFIDTNSTAVVPNFTWVTGDDSVYYNVDTPGVLHTFIAPGAYIPFVTISSPGCFVTITGDTIKVAPVPSVTVTHSAIICNGDTATLTATGAGPGGQYVWTSGYGLSCTTCAAVFANPTVTTTYTITGTTIYNCSDTAITTVSVDSVLTLHVTGRDSVCIGQCDTLIASGIGGNYTWTPDIGLSDSASAFVLACATSSHNYTVTAEDNRGCRASATFRLTINPLPVLSISPLNPYVCPGSSRQIIVSGAATYVWSPATFLSCTSCNAPVVSDTAITSYEIVGTTAFGCVDSEHITVIVYDSTTVTISNDTTICKGKSAQLLATSSYSQLATASYSWAPPAGLNDPSIQWPIATPDSTTTYVVTIDENLCYPAVTRSVTVTVDPNPIVIVPSATTIIAGSSVQLLATLGNSVPVSTWEWTPAATLSCDGCTNPIATPTNTTTYTVTAITPIGCIGDNSVQVSLICVEASQVFVPNTFTPNGDGSNDRFYLSGKGLGLITRMSIYNRWGEEVFSAQGINANDPSAGWDGTYKGQVLSPDVYVYVFDLFCETGVPFTLKGDISIVR